MNDTMSLLLATGILAVGGLGLFMYKNSTDEESFLDEDTEKSEESWFDLRSFFGNSNNDEDVLNEDNDDDELEVYETKTKSRGSKTKSVRKTGGTKRRY